MLGKSIAGEGCASYGQQPQDMEARAWAAFFSGGEAAVLAGLRGEALEKKLEAVSYTHLVDQGRLSLLLAVLEKRAGVRLFGQDVYINIAGGMTLTEPAADLALCAAVVSSLRAKPIGGTFAVMGEVGLAGEVRAVPQAERRLNECMRLGFQNVVLPKGNLLSLIHI